MFGNVALTQNEAYLTGWKKELTISFRDNSA